MKKYELRPPQKKEVVNEDGERVLVEDKDHHPEDRTIVITKKEVISQDILAQLSESARAKLAEEEKERVTPANLKIRHNDTVEDIERLIKQANEIAVKLLDISAEFPELGLSGLPSEIKTTDKISDLESKKPLQRKKKEQ